MRAVVDTNVVAYYLLGNTHFEAEARSFWQRLREPLAPALWEADIANVVYDTLFVELADREKAPLATFDRRLLDTWPEIARRPADLGAR